MKNLEGFQVGDKVWSPRYGHGVVKDINGGNSFPILVDFEEKIGDVENVDISYSLSGKEYNCELYPTLFFGIPDYENNICPERPRWRAKKDEVYFYVDNEGCTDKTSDSYTGYHNLRFKRHNYFKSSEEAQESPIFKVFYREED